MSDDSTDKLESTPASLPHEDFRIGLVQYLNSVPLAWRLPEIAEAYDASVVLESGVPSRLAIQLAAGELDAAIMPIVEGIRHPELVQISDVCIASEGTVGSIEFIAFKPMDELHRVGLDPSSRTSNALLQICLQERFGVECDFQPFTIDIENADFSIPENCEQLAAVCAEQGMDGILLIGDKALSVPHRSPYFPWIYDMGKLWTQWIGLPFVYASWFARKETDTERLSAILNDVRRASQLEMDTLILSEASNREIPVDFCQDYLTCKIRYRLGGRERRGVEVFCKMLQKHGLVPLGAEPDFEANRKRFENE